MTKKSKGTSANSKGKKSSKQSFKGAAKLSGKSTKSARTGKFVLTRSSQTGLFKGKAGHVSASSLSSGRSDAAGTMLPQSVSTQRGQAEYSVSVHNFEPERGTAVLEFNSERVRYTRERTAEQVFAIADYLRARRGFSTDQEMAEVLGVHRSRLIAWKQGLELPNAANSQLLSHLAVVVQELEEFLDPDVIPDWLLTEQYTLAGRTPVDVLRAGQLAEVLQTANATEHGAYI